MKSALHSAQLAAVEHLVVGPADFDFVLVAVGFAPVLFAIAVPVEAEPKERSNW